MTAALIIALSAPAFAACPYRADDGDTHTGGMKQMKNTNLMGAIEELPREALAARLREIMPGIDLRIREGVRHEAIVSALNAKGFALSLGAFRKILYRWRKTIRAPTSSAAKAPEPVRSPRAKPFGISEAFAAAPADMHPRDRSAPSRAGLDAILDPATRDAIGEKYLARGRPLFKSKGNGET